MKRASFLAGRVRCLSCMIVEDRDVLCHVILVERLGTPDGLLGQEIFNCAGPFDELALAPCGSLHR